MKKEQSSARNRCRDEQGLKVLRERMKAIVYYEYGSPDVLKLEEVEKPSAGDD